MMSWSAAEEPPVSTWMVWTVQPRSRRWATQKDVSSPPEKASATMLGDCILHKYAIGSASTRVSCAAAARRPLARQLNLAQPTRPAEGQPETMPGAVGLHVAHDRRGGGDANGFHLFGFGIKSHHLVGARFTIPDPAIGPDGDPIGPGIIRGRLPLPYPAGPRIERAEVSPAVVGVPHRSVGSDLQPPGPGSFCRQHELLHGTVGRADAAQLVGPEHGDPDEVVRARHDAVRHRTGSRRLVHLDLPGREIETAVAVVVRVGKPDLAAIDDGGVGVLCRVGQRILHDLAGCRVESPQEAGALTGVPDSAIGSDGDP